MSCLTIAVFGSFCSQAQSYADSLTSELFEHYQTSDLPGFSVAIVNELGVLYEKAFGFADKEERVDYQVSTVQNVGSVSKTFVGLALIKAIEDGKLTMETKVNEVLPFKVVNPYFKDEPILIRHLANHTSGIRDTKHYAKTYILDEGFVENEFIHRDFLSFIKGHSALQNEEFLYNILAKEGSWYSKKNYLKAKPGTTKEYANLNAALAALIIEEATGIAFDEYTNDRVFKPLALKNTSWSRKDGNIDQLATSYFPAGKQVPWFRLVTYPDGGLFSNTSDLSIYLAEMISAFSGSSTYLGPEYARILLPGDDDSYRAFWGMGEQSRNIGHGGSDPGIQADLQFNADKKVGRIILTNVNAEDNDSLWDQYRDIHKILSKYEDKITLK